jgi:parallel beta-helix repeat protein
MKTPSNQTGLKTASRKKNMPAPVKEFSLILVVAILVFIISYHQADTGQDITGYSALNNTINETVATATNQTEEAVVGNISTPPDTSTTAQTTSSQSAEAIRITGLQKGISASTEDTIDLSSQGSSAPEKVMLKDDSDNLIAELEIDFAGAGNNIDLSTLTADTDFAEKKAVLHMDTWPSEIDDDKTLYIPSTGTGLLYICPEAETLDEVNESCHGRFYLKEGMNAVNITKAKTVSNITTLVTSCRQAAAQSVLSSTPTVQPSIPPEINHTFFLNYFNSALNSSFGSLTVEQFRNRTINDIKTRLLIPEQDKETAIALLKNHTFSVPTDPFAQELANMSLIEFSSLLAAQLFDPPANTFTIWNLHRINSLHYLGNTTLQDFEDLLIEEVGTGPSEECIPKTSENAVLVSEIVEFIEPLIITVSDVSVGSNQYYKVEGLTGTGGGETIEILNINTSVRSNETWAVNFTTTGTANLTITPINSKMDSGWTELLKDLTLTINEMTFLNLSCGDQDITSDLLVVVNSSGTLTYIPYSNLDEEDSYLAEALLYVDYSCNSTATINNHVHHAGYIGLYFTFGDEEGYAWDATCCHYGAYGDTQCRACESDGGWAPLTYGDCRYGWCNGAIGSCDDVLYSNTCTCSGGNFWDYCQDGTNLYEYQYGGPSQDYCSGGGSVNCHNTYKYCFHDASSCTNYGYNCASGRCNINGFGTILWDGWFDTSGWSCDGSCRRQKSQEYRSHYCPSSYNPGYECTYSVTGTQTVYDNCAAGTMCDSGFCVSSGYCGTSGYNKCGGAGSPYTCQVGYDLYRCDGSNNCNYDIGDSYNNVPNGFVCTGSGTQVAGSCSNRCGYTGYNQCGDKCTRGRDCLACNGGGSCTTDVGDDWLWTASNKVCSGGSDIDASSGYSCRSDNAQQPYCSNGACSGYYHYAECNGGGTCDTNADVNYQLSSIVYASSGYTLTSSCGTTGTSLCGYSSYNACGGAGSPYSCQKKRDQLRCNGAGTCNSDVGDQWANVGYGNVCSGGNEYSGSSSYYCGLTGYNACSGACQKKRDYLACNGANACTVDVGNLYSYLSLSGYACSGGSEVLPSGSSNCDTTINCASGSCSASRWYRGCVSGGASCTDTNRQAYSAWNAPADNTISETTYKVGTSCAYSSAVACSGTDHCSNDDRYSDYRCTGGGSCGNNYNLLWEGCSDELNTGANYCDGASYSACGGTSCCNDDGNNWQSCADPCSGKDSDCVSARICTDNGDSCTMLSSGTQCTITVLNDGYCWSGDADWCAPDKADGNACTFDYECGSGYCDNDGVGDADDGWCFTPVSTYYDGQESTKCEYSATALVSIAADEKTGNACDGTSGWIDSACTYYSDGDSNSNTCSCVPDQTGGDSGKEWNIDGEVSSTTCCGDDADEYDLDENYGATLDPAPSNNDDACCNAATKCIDDNVCRTSGYATADVDADGDNDYCNAGQWIDCNTAAQCDVGEVCIGGDCTTPVFTDLLYPEDNWNLNETIIFECNITAETDLANTTLYHNYSGSWASNGTDTSISGTQNESRFDRTGFTAEKTFVWNCYACSDAGGCAFADYNYTITTDLTLPDISFVPPTPPNNNRNSTTQDWLYVNVSTTETNNHSALLDFNRSLVGWWRFENNALDSSTYADSWTCSTCPLLTVGARGKAYKFNGDDTSMNIGNGAHYNKIGTGSLTVLAWARTRSSAFQSILDNKEGGTNLRGYNLQTSSGRPFFRIANSSFQASITSPINISEDGEWHHIAGVVDRDAAKLRIFVDGYETNGPITTYNGWDINGTSSLYVGRGPYGGGFGGFFNGSIDEVMIFNRILSAAEINATFKAQLYAYENNFTGLVPGTHNYTAYAVDMAGNLNQTDYRNFSVNYIPIISNLVLNSTSVNNYTEDNMTAWYDASDTDGDIVKNITSWYVNGESFMLLNMPFESTGGNNESAWVKDYTSLSNHGTVNGGATWNPTGGPDGRGAYEFDEPDEDVQIAGLHAEQNAYTIAFWVKPGTRSERMLLFNFGGATSQQYTDLRTSGVMIHIHGTVGAYTGITTQGTFTTDKWNHWAVTWDGVDMVAYINGMKDPASDTADNPVIQTAATNIGSFYPSLPFNGSISDVMIFNRSLTADQIRLIYENKTDKLHFNETATGDQWQVCITPNDGIEDGAEVCSSTVTVKVACEDNDNDGFGTENSANLSACTHSHTYDCNDTDANILPPYDGMNITDPTEICSGTYYLNDAAGDGFMFVASRGVNPSNPLPSYTTSSSYYQANTAENAIDGDPDTQWISDGTVSTQWIRFDMGYPTHISGINISVAAIASPQTMTIAVSNNDVDWSVVKTNWQETSEDLWDSTTFTESWGQYINISFSDTQASTGYYIDELRVRARNRTIQSPAYVRCEGVTLIGNNAGYGFYEVNATDFNISGIVLSNYSTGIYLGNTNSSIHNVTFANSTYGLYINESDNNNITNSTFINNTYGTYIKNSSNNLFYYNNFTDSSLYHAFTDSTDNHFNTTVGGLAHGNYWNGIESFKIYDTNSDGFADGGVEYPYNSSNGGNVTNISDWGPITNRTDYRILSPSIIQPSNHTIVTDSRNPLYSWNNSDHTLSHDVGYEIQIDNNADFSSPEVDTLNITENSINTSYWNESNLDFNTDYFWRARANDTYNNSLWGPTYNFSILPTISCTEPVDDIDFGQMCIFEDQQKCDDRGLGSHINDTLDNHPPPYIIENLGNLKTKGKSHSTNLWESPTKALMPHKHYQYEHGVNESGSFEWALVAGWENMTNTSGTALEGFYGFKWENVSDAQYLHLRLEVPTDEPPGVKYSTTYITCEQNETY